MKQAGIDNAARPQFALVILENQSKDTYAEVKYVSDVLVGVPSQCVIKVMQHIMLQAITLWTLLEWKNVISYPLHKYIHTYIPLVSFFFCQCIRRGTLLGLETKVRMINIWRIFASRLMLR